ncbi:hypothetical protein [Leucobacter celer]|uniref:hypothetical protein n=1 Tax=Leucobacter celer TaxID=668625 RepID=UPI0006A792DC|nr:hypothetical protein [Leucobacter celer]
MTSRAERRILRRDEASARATIREAAPKLRGGLYVKGGARLWRRIGGPPLPEHVRLTKAAVRSPRSSAGRLTTARRFLRDLRQCIWLPGASGNAEIAIVAFDGGTVLVDPRGGRVFRTYGGDAIDERYLGWRRAFTRHVAAPAFEVADDGRTLVEEFVDGRHLLELAPAERIETLRALLLAYAALTAAEGDPGASRGDFAARLQRAVDRAAPPGLREAWRETDAAWLERGDIPWVPSAYEAAAKNLMVRPDGSPAPIDLGDLQPEPFFAYPIGIVVASGDEVIRAFLDGALDPELTALFAAAGCPWAATAEQRSGLLLARTVHAAICDGESGAEPAADSLARRWRDLAQALVTAPPAPDRGAVRDSPDRSSRPPGHRHG